MDLGLNNKKSPWWLWVILGVLMVVVGLGSYVYGKTGGLTISDIKDAFSKAEVKTEEVAKVEEADTTVAEEATATIPTDWKTYTDSTYNVSFRYPSSWSTPAVDVGKETDDGPGAFNRDSIGFTNPNVWIDITSFSTYRGEKYADALSPKLDKLINVYNTKSVSGLSEALWLPPSNAAIIAATAPKYIENADKSWRGIYYYAQMGQDDPTAGKNLKKLVDVMVIMTDGTDKVIQFHQPDKADSINDAYTMSSTCLSGTNNFTCEVSNNATSDFDSIYKVVAASVKTVDITANWKTYTNSTYGFSLKYPQAFTYTEDTAKSVMFRSAEDVSQQQECLRVQKVQCYPGYQLKIDIDGGPNGNTSAESSLTLDKIVQKRVTEVNYAVNPTKITLAGQSAYEAISIGMVSSFVNVTKRNNNLYELTWISNCPGDNATIESCKSQLSDTQKNIKSTLQFTK